MFRRDCTLDGNFGFPLASSAPQKAVLTSATMGVYTQGQSLPGV